jgi:hypothetical protein
MSHSMIFLRFEGSQVASIPCDSLLRVLQQHGFGSVVLKEGVNDLYPYPVDETADTPIGEVTIFVKAGTVTELGIDRPRYKEGFRAFAFDLISKVGLVMFPSHGGELYASAEAVAGLPEWLLPQFEHVNLDVQSADDLP